MNRFSLFVLGAAVMAPCSFACSSSSPNGGAASTAGNTSQQSSGQSSGHHSSNESDDGDGGDGVTTGEWNGTVLPADGSMSDQYPCDAVNDCCNSQIESNADTNPYCMGIMFTDADAGQPLCAEIFQLALDYGYCGGVTYDGYTSVDYPEPSRPGDIPDAGSGDDAGADADEDLDSGMPVATHDATM